MSESVTKKVMPLKVSGDKTDSLHFWPLHDLFVTVYVFTVKVSHYLCSPWDSVN